MTLTVQQRIASFWLLAVLAVALLLATHEARILHDYFDFTMFLPFLAISPAIMTFRRLTTDFRPPRWIRIYGWVCRGRYFCWRPGACAFPRPRSVPQHILGVRCSCDCRLFVRRDSTRMETQRWGRPTLQRTRPSRSGCYPCASWPPSLRLGRWP